MKTTLKEKTLNPEMLAGAGTEGSSATQEREGYSSSIHDFIEKNYQRLSRWCHQRWNSSGGDVMNSAVVIAIEGGYTYMTFSLFRRLCREAARKLRLNHTVYTADDVIILPPTLRAAERIEAHIAVAQADDPPEFPADCIRAARKMIRQEKKGQMHFWAGGAK
jgi:hypothetical protein